MSKILVIEDTPDIRALIVEMLETRGFQVICAENGKVGIRTAEREIPDLILCDIQMPGMNGYQVLVKLRENERTATIPLIFLTGVADKMQVRHGMELGADDYLTKPFTVQGLLAAVNARLETRATLIKAAERKLADLRDSITLSLPHEFLTPLNGILGFSSMLLDDGASLTGSEVQEFGGYIHESALRLQHITENFLLFSQLEMAASQNQTLPPATELLPVLERITSITRKKAHEAKRDNDLQLFVEDVRLGIDPAHIEKIAGELADNAFKFSEAGSPVTVQGSPQKGYFLLSVTNVGRGLTAEEIAALGAHSQFHRKKYEQQGSGLGLAISRRLSEMHGGSLRIESTPGERTTVNVQIPLINPSRHETTVV